jgi:HD-GYP domain-containing protein (c-di-GMP phosphodiesterase class II)
MTELRMPPASGGEEVADGALRTTGGLLITAMYTALRAIRLYPVENAAVQKALGDVAQLSGDVLRFQDEFEFRVSGEFLFINGTRLRLDLGNYASFSHLLSLFREAGVGTIRAVDVGSARDWLVLLSLLQSGASGDPDSRRDEVERKLAEAQVSAFELAPPGHAEGDAPEEAEQAKAAARRTYAQSVAATKDVINSIRMGRGPSLKKIKRVVQGIVDQILNEETSLLGLTTLRDYDEYTFTHSVNVCIFSVALGRRLGLTRVQLYDLGLAALFHDIGKSRVPLDVLNKPDTLSDDEWRWVAAHPWLGVLALFQMRGQQELPFRSMVVAYEHHMKIDMQGYPRGVRPRAMSIYSRIVAVADAFDAATSRRTYQPNPWSPAQVIGEMRDNPKRGMDPVVVKAFISLTGIFPVGTLVVLDTFELGLVHAPNAVPELLSRPIVRIVSDDKGNVLTPGHLVDLATPGPSGGYARTIIKTADPAQYGIRVSDYFV